LLTIGVALLPFIDEARLLSAMGPLCDELTEEEQARNTVGNDLLFMAPENMLYESLSETFYAMNAGVEVLSFSCQINPRSYI
jgi:5'-3' exoribonuclease 2